ncbi:3261_t:CDS:2 [Funneliformis geosporum]|uniref:3261_t:CDS:1 n=1 Tax=Funneliformis geosporum TaxID=1117311 RepID=A0A9W4SKA2_9GLOM|nr:3261_t:CDS:2 [Funneliformis geosporum]
MRLVKEVESLWDRTNRSSNRKWHNISQDPFAKAEWLLYKYGRAHALFYAIRLGNGFITVEVIQALLSKGAILSKYFIQRLFTHFGTYDENLISLKVEHNNALQKELSSPWGSNISMSIFTKLITEEDFHIFRLENKLNEIGDLLMASFQVILNVSKSEIASSCLIQAIKPERNLKETDLLEFLIQRIDNPKEALKSALDHYKVGLKFNAESIKTTKEIRSLTVHSNLYSWILKVYGPNSEITQKCFDDIIESRIWVDLKLQETPDRRVPEHLTKRSFKSICSIYLKFINKKVPFTPNVLQYFQGVSNYSSTGLEIPKFRQPKSRNPKS